MNRRQLLGTFSATGLLTVLPREFRADEADSTSAFADESVPSLPADSAGDVPTHWYHEDPDADVRLVPELETDILPQSEVSFSLHDETGRKFAGAPVDTRLLKLVDGEWYEIPQRHGRGSEDRGGTLKPRKEREWTVTVYDEDSGQQLLGPGRYAFHVTTTRPGEGAVYAAALFELEGTEPTLYPASEAREDDTRDVRYTFEGYDDAPLESRGHVYIDLLASSRVDELGFDAQPVIKEQLYQFPVLQTGFSEYDRHAFDMVSPSFALNVTQDRWNRVAAHFAPDRPDTDELVFQIDFDGSMGIDHFRLRYEPDESVFERQPVPELPPGPAGDVPTHWYHEDPDADVRFVPERELDILPRPGVSFTLHNETDDRIAAPPDYTRVLKLVDGEWYEIPPRTEYEDDDQHLEPGDTQERTVTVYDKKRNRQLLGPGRYAYHATVTLPDGETAHVAALFELEGNPPPLEPAPAAQKRTEDGQTVHWTFEGYDDAPPESRGQVHIERIDSDDLARTASEGRTVLREQLHSFPLLRTVFGEFDDDTETVVTEVTREEWRPVSRAFATDEAAADAFVFEFEGEYYHVRREPEGSAFAGESVPQLPPGPAGDVPTHWYHEDPDADVRLVPSLETNVLPLQSGVSFTFINETDQRIDAPPDQNRLLKLVDGEWYEIPQRREDEDEGGILQPGDTREETVTVYDEDRENQLLGPGLYAYHATTPLPNGETVHVAALFELEGTEPTLYPAPEAREDDRRTVRYTFEGYDEAAPGKRGLVDIDLLGSSRVDELGFDAQPVIKEQLYQFPVLRTGFSEYDRLAFDMISPPRALNVTQEQWDQVTAHFAPDRPDADELVFQIDFDGSMGIDLFRLRYEPDESAFERESVPQLPPGPAGDVPTHWYHEDPDADVRLVPERETDVLPQSEVRFTLHNETDDRIAAPPDYTRVLKLVDGEWYETPPKPEYEDDDQLLDPDDTWEQAVTVIDEDRSHQLLGPGRYAYHATVTDGETAHVAALFELEGSPPPLEPAPAALKRTEDGQTVHWTFEGYDDVTPEYRRHIHIERLRSADVARTASGGRLVLREQLHSFPLLRTAFGEFDDDVETVVVNVTQTDWLPVSRAFATDEAVSDAFVFEFEGEYYHVRREPEGPAFAGESVPQLPPGPAGDVPTHWYHEDPDADVRLVPDSERDILPQQPDVSFTLHNDSDHPITAPPDYTRVLKLVDGEWYETPPRPEYEDGDGTLYPCDTWEETVSVYDENRDHQLLGPGLYAYHVTTTLQDGETVYAAALFELDGTEPPLELAPEARDEGGSGIVRYTFDGYEDVAPESRGEIHVERLLSDDVEALTTEAQPVIREQLYPFPVLRTGFGLYDRLAWDMFSSVAMNVTQEQWDRISAHFAADDVTTDELVFEIDLEDDLDVRHYRVRYEPDEE